MVESIQSYKETQKPIQIIKPTINPFLILLDSSIITVLAYAFLAMVLGAPLAFNIDSLSDVWVAIIIGLAIFMFLFSLLVVFLVKRAILKRTEYKFYSDKVEFFEGFFVKKRKTITYDRVSNVGQRVGFLEGLFGLGSIFVDTAGYSSKGHELSMRYLKDPNEVYDWILHILPKKQ